jgi:hypothetical protein
MKTNLNKQRNVKGDAAVDLIIAFCIILLLVVAFGVGISIGTDDCKKNAVEAGVAHYEVNPKTGQTSFVWHTNTIDKISK